MTTETLSDVVTELCLRSGLSAGQFDVSGIDSITKPVRALSISQVGSTRSVIELLMTSHYFEMTVSDKIYFVARGGSAAANIPYGDLGAGIDDTTEPVSITQKTDIELPAQVAVSYLNVNFDHQPDTQYSDRLVTAVANTVSEVQLAIGLTPSEAKGIAETIALDQQISIVGSTISVLGSYSALEPTDVITATDRDGNGFQLRIVKKTDSYPMMELECVLDNAAVLIGEGTTSGDYNSSSSVEVNADTLAEFLDIPILRDADDDPGFYVVAKGDGTPWPGAVLFESPDDVTYTSAASITSRGVFGECLTTLGDWTGPRVFDEKNTVEVDLDGGTATSYTRDEILNDSSKGAWLIGNEVIQAREATLTIDSTYVLSGLLRGCRGTEWAMVDHVSSERCVLLQMSGMARVIEETSDLGISTYYKAVTLSRSIDSVDAETFTNNGIGKKPFAPVAFRYSRDASDNLTFSWQRRTRLATRTIGPLGISIPLGESTEAYRVILYDGATLLRTIDVSSPTASYTASDQTTDGITPGSDVDVYVYQISSIVNLGYPLVGTTAVGGGGGGGDEYTLVAGSASGTCDGEDREVIGYAEGDLCASPGPSIPFDIGSLTPDTFDGVTITAIGETITESVDIATTVAMDGSAVPQDHFTSITIGAITLLTEDAQYYPNVPPGQTSWIWLDGGLLTAVGTYTVTIV